MCYCGHLGEVRGGDGESRSEDYYFRVGHSRTEREDAFDEEDPQKFVIFCFMEGLLVDVFVFVQSC